jgi:hypothetical protein
MIAEHFWGLTSLRKRKLHGHKENTAAVFLCDVAAYAEVCLLSRSLETGCITALFYCCVRILLRNAVSVAQQFLHGANTPQYEHSRSKIWVLQKGLRTQNGYFLKKKKGYNEFYYISIIYGVHLPKQNCIWGRINVKLSL